MLVEKVIQDWLKELKFSYPVMIQKIYSTKPRRINIITRYPGVLIGKGGQDINRLRERLADDYDIRITEADEIICTSDTKIDTRDWDDIIDERVNARLEMWNM